MLQSACGIIYLVPPTCKVDSPSGKTGSETNPVYYLEKAFELIGRMKEDASIIAKPGSYPLLDPVLPEKTLNVPDNCVGIHIETGTAKFLGTSLNLTCNDSFGMNGCQFLNLTFLLGAIANVIPEVHIIRSIFNHVSILHYKKQEDLRTVQFLFENTKFESDTAESLLKIAIESNEKIGIKTNNCDFLSKCAKHISAKVLGSGLLDYSSIFDRSSTMGHRFESGEFGKIISLYQNTKLEKANVEKLVSNFVNLVAKGSSKINSVMSQLSMDVKNVESAISVFQENSSEVISNIQSTLLSVENTIANAESYVQKFKTNGSSILTHRSTDNTITGKNIALYLHNHEDNSNSILSNNNVNVNLTFQRNATVNRNIVNRNIIKVVKKGNSRTNWTMNNNQTFIHGDFTEDKKWKSVEAKDKSILTSIENSNYIHCTNPAFGLKEYKMTDDGKGILSQNGNCVVFPFATSPAHSFALENSSKLDFFDTNSNLTHPGGKHSKVLLSGSGKLNQKAQGTTSSSTGFDILQEDSSEHNWNTDNNSNTGKDWELKHIQRGNSKAETLSSNDRFEVENEKEDSNIFSYDQDGESFHTVRNTNTTLKVKKRKRGSYVKVSLKKKSKRSYTSVNVKEDVDLDRDAKFKVHETLDDAESTYNISNTVRNIFGELDTDNTLSEITVGGNAVSKGTSNETNHTNTTARPIKNIDLSGNSKVIRVVKGKTMTTNGKGSTLKTSGSSDASIISTNNISNTNGPIELKSSGDSSISHTTTNSSLASSDPSKPVKKVTGKGTKQLDNNVKMAHSTGNARNNTDKVAVLEITDGSYEADNTEYNVREDVESDALVFNNISGSLANSAIYGRAKVTGGDLNFGNIRSVAEKINNMEITGGKHKCQLVSFDHAPLIPEAIGVKQVTSITSPIMINTTETADIELQSTNVAVFDSGSNVGLKSNKTFTFTTAISTINSNPTARSTEESKPVSLKCANIVSNTDYVLDTTTGDTVTLTTAGANTLKSGKIDTSKGGIVNILRLATDIENPPQQL